MAIDNLGLLSGLAQGLNAGVESYTSAKQKALDNKYKQVAMQSGLVKEGQMQDEQGNVINDPNSNTEAGRKRKMLDPTSPETARTWTSAESTYKAAGEKPENFGLTQENRNKISGAEIEDTMKNFGAKTVTGQYGLNRAQIQNQARQQQIELNRNKNAQDAGKEFDNDSILKDSQRNLTNIAKADSIFNGNAKINYQALNLLQTDLIRSTTPGQPTEGLIHREIATNLAAEINKLQGFTGTVADLRKDPKMKQTLDNIQQLMGQVKGDFQNAISDRAAQIHDTYSANNDPLTRKVVAEKLGSFSPGAYRQFYGKEYSSKYHKNIPTSSEQKPPTTLPSQNQAGPGNIGGAPKVGTIEDGHTFLGGDPSDSKNWKLVQ